MIMTIVALLLAAQEPMVCPSVASELEAGLCATKAEQRLATLWSELHESERARLNDSQQAWLSYRNEQCGTEAGASGLGTISTIALYSCRQRLTDQRWVELQNLSPKSHLAERAIELGSTYKFEAHEADHEVNVVLPLSYADNPERRYPVVYMLDGGVAQDLMMQVGVARWTQMWRRTQDFILVGIETKDRQRELLPPTTDKEALDVWPTAGESAAFRDYVRDDVKRMVDSRYRTDGRDYLIGESAAGHFVVETLLVEPALFDGYAAISPSLWWEDQLLAKLAEAQGAGTAPLFISIANEGQTMDEGVRRIVAARGDDSATCFADRPDQTHAVTFHALLPGALQFLLPDEKPLPEEWAMVPGCTNGGN